MSILNARDLSREEVASLPMVGLQDEIGEDHELAAYGRTLDALGDGEIEWSPRRPKARRQVAARRAA